LGKLLDEPDAKRVCFGGVGRPEADDMVPDVDIDDPDQPDHSPSNFGDICFRVVLLRPGSKKTLPLKPGSGRKVRPDHVAITIHAVVVAEGADDANRAVASTPLLPRGSCTVSPDPVALLTDLAADVNELEKGFKCWERQPMMYTLADVSFTPPAGETATLCDIVSLLVASSAFPGGGGFFFDPEGKSSVYPCLRDLHHQGFVNSADPESDLWALSEMGMKRLRPVWVLKSL
jgi:hypothetical protein